MIYLDNAATSLPKPKAVIEAVVQAMESMGNSARGTHEGSLSASRCVHRTREKLGRMFNCSPERVVFTANSTEALNIAIAGLFKAGDHVISTDLEHNSVLRPLYRLEAEEGVALSFVPADSRGQVDHADFTRLLRPNTRGIVCTHASNLSGDQLDLYRIGSIARENGLLLLVDASQTAGCFPIDMQAMGIDVLCFTGHKSMLGPQGTGGLCIGEGVEIRPFKLGGSGIESYNKSQPAAYPARLEAGTLNAHGIAGLEAAVDFIHMTGMEQIRKKETALMRRFYEGVKDIGGVRIYGDFSRERSPVVALNLWDYDSAAVSDQLFEDYGIATRPGAHCAPRMHTALGTKEQGAVRFSFSYFNTEEEVDAAIKAIKELSQ